MARSPTTLQSSCPATDLARKWQGSQKLNDPEAFMRCFYDGENIKGERIAPNVTERQEMLTEIAVIAAMQTLLRESLESYLKSSTSQEEKVRLRKQIRKILRPKANINQLLENAQQKFPDGQQINAASIGDLYDRYGKKIDDLGSFKDDLQHPRAV
jgi:predicted nucleotidyltransferase